MWPSLLYIEDHYLIVNENYREIEFDNIVSAYSTQIEGLNVECDNQSDFRYKPVNCRLYTAPSPRGKRQSRMPSSA